MLVLALASCGGDAPDWAVDYQGPWRLYVDALAACWPPRQLDFTIDRGDVESANDEAFSTSSEWHYADDQTDGGSTTGSIDRTGSFVIEFQRGDGQARFEGSDPTASVMNGVLSDPQGVLVEDPAGCTAGAYAEPLGR